MSAGGTRYVLLALIALVSACTDGDDGSDGNGTATPPPQNVVDPEPAMNNTVIRLFSRPFVGEYRVLNYFDHDRPVAPNDVNGYQLNWRGERAYPGRHLGGYDGHQGIDWLLPQDTPLFAVTSAEIVFAGPQSFRCFLEDNALVTQLTVILQFVASDGATYRLLYTHLNRVDVAVGDVVTEGQQIGLSGATGCVGRSRTPHLHFELLRMVSLSPPQGIVIDPYGWEGPTPDPWAIDDSNRTSIWFWKQGRAPDLVL